MKVIILLVTLFCITACQSTSETEQANVNLNGDIAESVANSDYRLLSTSNRLPQFPGTDPKRYQEFKKLCGAKFIQGTGDVRKRSEDPNIRIQLIKYMKQYNQAMIKACLKNR